MIIKGFTNEDIAYVFNISFDEIEKLRNEM